MQKKLLFFFMVIGCSVFQAEESDNNIPKQNESYFDCLPEGLRNRIPVELQKRAEQEYRNEEEKKLNDEINVYYTGSLEKEFDRKGSIQDLYLQKKAQKEAELIALKKEICSCSRGKGIIIGSGDTQTQVVHADRKYEKETALVIEKYAKASERLLERFVGIEREVNNADAEYTKKEFQLKQYIDSIKECGCDMACHYNNGVVDVHLTDKYRKELFAKIFAAVVKSCKDQGIADEEELSKIWASNAKLKPHQEEIKRMNDWINEQLTQELLYPKN